VPTEDAEEVDCTKQYSYDISLRFNHPSIDPAKITAALCLKPSRVWRAGGAAHNAKG
jgi:hypothetical protein